MLLAGISAAPTADPCCCCGGGSDIRIGGLGNPCATDESCGLADRIIVGGGGGGAVAGDGAVGGGVVGGPGPGTEQGGMQEKRGFQDFGFCRGTNEASGSFGLGGSATADALCPGGSGGGGSGWYGGAAGPYGAGGSGLANQLTRTPAFPGGTNGSDGLVVISTP